jgi:hypothetical protein
MLDTLNALKVRRINNESRYRCQHCQESQSTAAKWKGKIDLRAAPDGSRRLVLYCFTCDPAGRGKEAKATTLEKAGLTYSDLVVGSEVDVDAVEAELGVVAQKYNILESRDTLDAVYRTLLVESTLRRGEQYHDVPGAGRHAKLVVDAVRDAHPGVDLCRVPGFIEKDDVVTLMGAGVEGVLIPCRDALGRIFSIKIRKANATTNKMLTLSSKAYGGPGPIVEAHYAGDPRKKFDTVFLTEGEKKADVAAAKLGCRVVSVPGVRCARMGVDAVRTLGARKVVLAFDNDIAGRRGALEAHRLVSQLDGVSVWFATWPNTHKGIDDALNAGVEIEKRDASFVEELGVAVAKDEEKAAFDPTPALPAKGGREAKAFRMRSGEYFYDLDPVETPQWIPNVLTPGLTLFAAPPKDGKSWENFDLAVAFASGGNILFPNFKATPRKVLLLSLEDDDNQVRRRIHTQYGDSLTPAQREGIRENLRIVTVSDSIGRMPEALDDLKLSLDEFPAELVLIDTLVRFGNPNRGKGSVFEEDYNRLLPLFELAHARQIAIVVTHHTNKGKHEDYQNEISGSTGNLAGVDNIWLLRRYPYSKKGILSTKGRELEENRWDVELDDNCRWWVKGKFSEEFDPAREPVLNAVVALLQGGERKKTELAAAVHDAADVKKLKVTLARVKQFLDDSASMESVGVLKAGTTFKLKVGSDDATKPNPHPGAAVVDAVDSTPGDGVASNRVRHGNGSPDGRTPDSAPCSDASERRDDDVSGPPESCGNVPPTTSGESPRGSQPGVRLSRSEQSPGGSALVPSADGGSDGGSISRHDDSRRSDPTGDERDVSQPRPRESECRIPRVYIGQGFAIPETVRRILGNVFGRDGDVEGVDGILGVCDERRPTPDGTLLDDAGSGRRNHGPVGMEAEGDAVQHPPRRDGEIRPALGATPNQGVDRPLSPESPSGSSLSGATDEARSRVPSENQHTSSDDGGKEPSTLETMEPPRPEGSTGNGEAHAKNGPSASGSEGARVVPRGVWNASWD